MGSMCVKGYYKNLEATKDLFAGGVIAYCIVEIWPSGMKTEVLRFKAVRKTSLIAVIPFIFHSLSCLKCLFNLLIPTRIMVGEGKFSSIAVETLLEALLDILEAGVRRCLSKVLAYAKNATFLGTCTKSIAENQN